MRRGDSFFGHNLEKPFNQMYIGFFVFLSANQRRELSFAMLYGNFIGNVLIAYIVVCCVWFLCVSEMPLIMFIWIQDWDLIST